ncbi:hypothetical protein GE09DRAFT_158749 [Coniochaeta sp. 2T2.1]|nr:hypothetical protein GE09DRAFT_158749 [Coniochaeta sp. 2T2.1]
MRLNTQVAVITGGVSGMGLAVAEALVKKGWFVALLDVNREAGKKAVNKLGPFARFIKTDVTKYAEQAAAFESIFEVSKRIDFVFANAGIAGRADFYDRASQWPPPPPSFLTEEIGLRGAVLTSYLAMHYMRRNQSPGGVIVATASAASIYASPELPLYAAAKHGVLGFVRSVSEGLSRENIRVNAILPGAIQTSLHSQDTWSQFPAQDFTPVEEVVDAVLGLVTDAQANGRALEISAGEVFDRRQPEYCNETMSRIMRGKSYSKEP